MSGHGKEKPTTMELYKKIHTSGRPRVVMESEEAGERHAVKNYM